MNSIRSPRWNRIGTVLATGMLFQAGGCTFDGEQIFSTLVTTFVGLSLNSFVSAWLGVPVF